MDTDNELTLAEYIDEHPEIFEQSVMIFLETMKNLEVQFGEIEFSDVTPDDIEVAEQFADDLHRNGFSQEDAEKIIQYANQDYDEGTALMPEFKQWVNDLGETESASDYETDIDLLQSIYLSGLEFFAPSTAESPF